MKLTSYHKNFNAQGGRYQVMIGSSRDWSLTAPQNCTWVEPSSSRGHSGDVVTFEIKPNTQPLPLTADFVFVSGKAEAVFRLEQEAGEPIELSLPEGNLYQLSHRAQNEYKLKVVAKGVDAGSVEVQVKTMEQSQSWLSFISVQPSDNPDELFLVFKVEQLSGNTDRQANVVITAPGVTHPVEATFIQKASVTLVEWAAQMNGARLFPKWEAGGMGQCRELTVEMLFKPDQLTKQISTLFGVEGYLLLRIGDANYPSDQLQISSRGGKYPVVTMYPQYPVPDFVPNKWYHIALVFNSGNMKIFIDGKPCFDATFYQSTIDYSPQWSYENGGGRCFWFGYSYDESRDFYGLMTEIRIWKKALTFEQINAPDHFYSVDPHSQGLFSYWKFDKSTSVDGQIEDATGHGNKLYGETNVRKQGTGIVQGYAGINFAEVALPEQ